MARKSEQSEAGLGEEILAALASVSTATLSMQLLKRGIRNCWLKGPRPQPSAAFPATEGGGGPRLAGEAYTFSFIPLREDLSTTASYAAADSIRAAIEEMPAGRVAVIDARAEDGAGTLGDLLVERIAARGGRGVVSDGPLRDLEEVLAVGLPVFCAGAASPPSVARLAFAGWQRPIGCGGVAVIPGDVVVGDGDGVVVVPRALAEEIAAAAPEQERFERFAKQKLREGRPIAGLYPPDEATLAEYETWEE